MPPAESNQRTRFRKPLLYPLSYGGADGQGIAGRSAVRVAQLAEALGDDVRVLETGLRGLARQRPDGCGKCGP